MSESPASVHAYIEVAFSDRPSQVVPVDDLPFFIGRGRENGNHLPIDDMRISRKCVAISAGASGLLIEDHGQRDGVFINGLPTKTRTLADGDRIRLGTDDGCQLIFRLPSQAIVQHEAETKLRSLMSFKGNDSADELRTQASA